MTYIIEVDRGSGWQTVARAGNSYDAHAVYNQLPDPHRRILRIGATGGEIIRTSEQDGYAATWAARVQEAQQ